MDEASYNGRRERLDVSLLRATPTLARLAAGASVRTAQWGLATSVRVGTRMIRAAAAGESPAQLMADASGEVRDYVRHFLDEHSPLGSCPARACAREVWAAVLVPHTHCLWAPGRSDSRPPGSPPPHQQKSLRVLPSGVPRLPKPIQAAAAGVLAGRRLL